MDVMQAASNAFVQLIVFLLIPFVWWLIGWRKTSSFLDWVGLRKIQLSQSRLLVKMIVVFLICSLVLLTVTFISLRDSDLTSMQYAALGWTGTIPILLYAYVQTGLAEELFFRGFLLKRLVNKFGFGIGNNLQAGVFGVLHVILILSLATPGVFAIIAIWLATTGIAWSMGVVNERCAGGSIVPSWLLHGTSNVATVIIAAIVM